MPARRRMLPAVLLAVALALLLAATLPSQFPEASGEGASVELVDQYGHRLDSPLIDASVPFDTVDTAGGTFFVLPEGREIGTQTQAYLRINASGDEYELQISMSVGTNGSLGYLGTTGIRVVTGVGTTEYHAALDSQGDYQSYLLDDSGEKVKISPGTLYPLGFFTEHEYRSLVEPPAASGITFTFSIEVDEETHTLEFVSDGTVVATRTVTDNDTVGQLPSLQKTGYDLTGWRDSTGNPVYPDTPVSSLPSYRVYAVWTPIEYSIAYDLHGGTATGNPTTYTIESPSITLKAPSRTAYSFIGWTGTGISTPTTTVTIPTGSTGDRSYSANWTPVKYSISLDTAGGQYRAGYVPPSEYTIESGTIVLPTADDISKTGYDFGGWYAVPGGKPVTEIPSGSYGNVSLHAQWIPVTYSISYDLRGGAASGNPTSYTVESPSITLSAPSKEAYDFIGWTGTGVPTPSKTVTIPTGSTGDREYTANWSATEYTIALDADGGVYRGGYVPPTEYTIESQDVILPTADDISKNGYAFGGWTDGSRIITVIPSGSEGDISLKTVWSLIIYHIGYDLDGGIAYGNPTEYTIESKTIAIDNPSKVGYDFAGWIGTGLDKATLTLVIPAGSYGDREYTALWGATVYEIDLDTDGGIYSPGYVPPTEYTTESKDIILPTADDISKTGYDFGGWTDGSKIITVIPSGSQGDVSLKAVWSAITYHISYDLRGGTATGNPTEYTVESPSITLKSPSREAYEFIGWTGTGVPTPSKSVTIPTGSTDDREYTANWTPVEYDIVLDTDGGVYRPGYIAPSEYDIESETVILPTADDISKRGYSFGGWFTAAGKQVKEIPAGSYGDVELTAEWTAIVYSISYELSGGYAEGNPTEYTIESEDITLRNPSKDAYDFIGWTGTDVPAPSMTVTIPTGSIGDREYSAGWEPTVYSIALGTHGGVYRQGYVAPTEYTIESKDVILPTADDISKNGYAFGGWTDGSSIITVIPAGSHGDVSLEAVWSPITYYITYNLDGGHAEGNPTEYTIESKTITINNPSKEGYDFAGWIGTGLDKATLTLVIPAGSYGDREYTALWGTVVYEIDLDTDGGVYRPGYVPPTEYTTESKDVILPTAADISKAGYDFGGWTDGSRIITVIPSGSQGDVSLKAVWSAITYHISYDLRGGAVSGNPTEYTVESADITLKNPSREAYEFAGWTGTGVPTPSKSVTIPTGSTGDREYTANWTPVEYAIVLDTDGGIYSPGYVPPIAYTIESEDVILPTADDISKNGYAFGGWTDGSKIIAVIPSGSEGDVSLKAVWSPITYYITYNLDGGHAEGNPTEYTIESEDIAINNPVKKGYDFAGWIGTGIDEPTLSLVIPTGSYGDREYTALWEPVIFTITYMKGDTPIQGLEPSEYTVRSGHVTLPANVDIEGYTFAGWYANPGMTGSTVTGFESSDAEDKVFYGDFVPIAYTISLDTNGGAYTAGYVPPKTYTIESDDVVLPTADDISKRGYAFGGWSDGTGIITVIPAGSVGDREYTAVWTLITYHISYELSGGYAEGNPTEYTVESDEIRLNDPVRTGYDFAGWTGTDIPAPSKEVVIPAGSIGDREYTAVWTPIVYTITLDTDGGRYTDGYVPPKTYTIESEDVVLPTEKDISKTGYGFVGWTDGESLIETIPTGSYGDREYTAVWSPITYHITYDLRGGTAEGNPTEYTVESDDITLNEPVRIGYTFIGWTGTGIEQPVKEVTIPTGSTGDREYTANWTAAEYAIVLHADGGVYTEGYVPPTSYTVESDDIILPTEEDISKTGYTFGGWTDGTGIITVIPAGSIGDREYTAVWSPIIYQITYDLDGGYAEGNPTEYTVESEDIMLQAPSRDGHKFEGWIGTDLPRATKNVTIPAGSTGDREYTATWSALRYTIVYMDGSTQLRGLEPSGYNSDSGTVTLPTEVRNSGYSFEGWYGSKDLSGDRIYSFESTDNENKTFYGKFTAIVYSIVLDTDGGIYTEGYYPPTEYTIESGDIVLPGADDVSKRGYSIVGWTDGSEIVDVIPSGSVGNRAYTAVWSPITYNITYDLGGGYAEGNPTEYTVESDDIVLTAPTKEGSVFAGWVGTDVPVPTVDVIIPTGSVGDREYRATWTAMEYTITYYDGDSKIKGLEPSGYDTDSGTVVLPADVPKTGYEFAGWYDNVDLAGEPVTSFESSDMEDKAFYASFTIIVYRIVLDTTGGSYVEGYEPPTEYTIESRTVYLPTSRDIYHEGYDFMGWFATGDHEWIPTTSIPAGSHGDYVLSAGWLDDPDRMWPKVTETRDTWINDDGSVTTVITTNTQYRDGSYTEVRNETTTYPSGDEESITTEVEMNTDGSKDEAGYESKTVTNDDGSVTTTETEYTRDRDGSSSDRSSETKEYADGSVDYTTEEVITDADGSKETTECSITVRVQDDGSTITVTEMHHTEPDMSGKTVESVQVEDGGEIVSLEQTATYTDSDGTEHVYTATGGNGTIEVVMPDSKKLDVEYAKDSVEGYGFDRVIVGIQSEDGALPVSEETLSLIVDYGYSIMVASDELKVVLDEDAVKSVSGKEGDLVLSITRSTDDDLTEAQKAVIGDGYAITVFMTLDGVYVTDFSGNADIYVKYDDPDAKVYYVDSAGNMQQLESEYSEMGYHIEFEVDHFSIYYIEPKEKNDNGTLVIVLAAIIAAAIALLLVFIARRRHEE